jgi:hypothetical protein
MQSRSVLFAATRIVDGPGACIYAAGKEPQRT